MFHMKFSYVSFQRSIKQFIPMRSTYGNRSFTTKNCKVGYVTDIEGNLNFWNNYVNISKVLDRRDGQLQLRDDCHFVFGGDICDRGPGDLR